jgi:hypothetical protein
MIPMVTIQTYIYLHRRDIFLLYLHENLVLCGFSSGHLSNFIFDDETYEFLEIWDDDDIDIYDATVNRATYFKRKSLFTQGHCFLQRFSFPLDISPNSDMEDI